MGVFVIIVVFILVYFIRYDGIMRLEFKLLFIMLDFDFRKKVTVIFWGRNGNYMFEYFILIGVVKRNNMILILVEFIIIWNMFKLLIVKGSVENLDIYKRYKE